MSSVMEAPLVRQFDLLATAPGGVARLRELILTLAVQGKLVPQDPKDEPASVLLQKIRVEKDRLTAEGKIKREKLHSLVDDDHVPFDLPIGWEWARLEDFSLAIVDCPHSTPSFVSNGYLCIDTNSFKDGRLIPQKLRYVDEETFIKRNARLQPQPGDLVFAREGSVGESVIIPDGVVSCLGQRVMLFRFSEMILNKFIRLALISRGFLDGLLSLHKGIGAKHVNVGDMRMAIIPIPPVDQQYRIVTRVEELMRLCDALERQNQLETAQHAQLLNTLLGTLTNCTSPDELAANWQRVSDHFDLLLDRPEAIDIFERTLQNLAIQGRLVPQNKKDGSAKVLLEMLKCNPEDKIAPIDMDPKPFDLPDNWLWVQAKNLCRKNKIITYGILKPVWVDFGIPTVRVQDIKNGEISVTSVAHCTPDRAEKFSKTTLEFGDLLIAKDGATLGKTAFVPPSLVGGNITQHVLSFPISEYVNHDYVRLVVDSPHGQSWMRTETKGVALPGVNVGDFRRMPIPLPPLGEQTRIVACITQLRRLCSNLRQRLSARQSTQHHLAEALVDL